MRHTTVHRAVCLCGLLVLALNMSGTSYAREQVYLSGGQASDLVCGKELSDTYGGAVAESFTKPGWYEFGGSPEAERHGHEDQRVLVFTSSCSVGVSVKIEPRGVVVIFRKARTADGGVAGVSVYAVRAGRARVVATRRDGQRTVVIVRVRPEAKRCEHPNVCET